MTQSPVRLSRGFIYITGKNKKITERLKKSPICHGAKAYEARY